MTFEETKRYNLIIENQSELNITKNFFQNLVEFMMDNNFKLLETERYVYTVEHFQEILDLLEQIDDKDGDTLLHKRESPQYKRYESDEMTDDEYHFHSAGL